MSDRNLAVFIDSVGRTVLGSVVKDSKTVLEVKNPSVLHVQPNPENGQIQVQLIPIFFKEFAGANNVDTVWEYLKSGITMAKELKLDDRLIDQYTNMYSVIKSPESNIITPGQATDVPVVKLFDK
tara:strand:- start:550 stop:924 length:375 start_codon:yes stop_codon:yes gene_type:complete